MKRPGAVLCVANFESDVGYAWWLMENLWVQLGELARECGGRAIVAYPKVAGLSDRIRASGMEVVELEFPGPLGRLRRFIQDNHVTTVYLTDRYNASVLYPLLRLWGVRSIIVNDQVPGERPLQSYAARVLKRVVHATGLLTANLYVAPADFIRRRFVTSAGIPADRCVTVWNGVPEWNGPVRDYRSILGLPSDALVVGSVSRATTYKGIDFMIECADVLTREDPRVYFVHDGGGPDLDLFKKDVEDRGLQGRFFLLGRSDDIRGLIPSLTVALHASRGEAFSLAILEFMAAGLPVVIPDNCGNGEAVENMVSGILYPPRDVGAATSALRRLLHDAPLRERLGAAAKRRVAERFTLEEMNIRFREAVSPYLEV